MKKYLIHTVLLAVLFLSSCFKEDDKIEPHQQGDHLLGEVSMGTSYIQQSYFDLPTNALVLTTHIEDWDLAFSSGDEDWEVYLNTARMMYAASTGTTDFNAVTSSDGLEFSFDKSDGNPDSTAIGKWYTKQGDSIVSNEEVYVINLGQDANFNAMGFVKMTMKPVPGGYKLRIAQLDGSNEQQHVVLKSADHNLVFLHRDQGQVSIEPPREDWTLHFTKYSTVVYTDAGDPEDYNVVGVLLNRYNCQAALDTIYNFNDISLEDTAHFDFSTAIDRIGYDWKFYDFDNATYTIVPDMNFVIRDFNGLYYKLRFIDFYSNTGDKGTPRFEFVRL